MDDVESSEFDEAGIEESIGDPCTITVSINFKTGEQHTVSFKAPVWTPIYAEPLTGYSIFNILATAYSYTEAPFLALPLEDETYRFLDLSTTNFVDIKVVYD